MNQIFNSTNYTYSFYALPNLVTAIIILSLGLFIYFKNVRAEVNTAFGLTGLSIAIWQFGYFMAYLSKTPEVALFWCRFVYLGVPFISVNTYYVSYAVLKLKSKKILQLFYLIMFVFVFLAQTDYFISGVNKFFWGYQTQVGFLHNYFLVLWFLPGIVTIINLYNYFIKTKLAVDRNRKKYVFLGIFFAYFAIFDYIPDYGIEVYPFGFIPIIACYFTLAYAIIRYRAMDIDTVIHRTALWLITSSLIFVPIGGIVYLIHPWLAGLNWLPLPS